MPTFKFNFYKGKPKHISCKSYSENHQTGLYEFEPENKSPATINPTIRISEIKSVEEVPNRPDIEGVRIETTPVGKVP